MYMPSFENHIFLRCFELSVSTVKKSENKKMTVYNFMANPPVIKSSDMPVLTMSLVRSFLFLFVCLFLFF